MALQGSRGVPPRLPEDDSMITACNVFPCICGNCKGKPRTTEEVLEFLRRKDDEIRLVQYMADERTARFQAETQRLHAHAEAMAIAHDMTCHAGMCPINCLCRAVREYRRDYPKETK